VVQNDVGNRYAPETIVVPIRDLDGGRLLPVFVPVKAGVGGLTKDSIVDAGHINTVGTDQLGAPIGTLPPQVMELVDKALRVSLSLS
jgi:mRNA interferase MazF